MRNIFARRRRSDPLYLCKGKLSIYHWYIQNWYGYWPLFRVFNGEGSVIIETKYLTIRYAKENA